MPRAVLVAGKAGPVEVSVAEALATCYDVTAVTDDYHSYWRFGKELGALANVTVKSLLNSDLGEALAGAEVVFVSTHADNTCEDGIKQEVREPKGVECLYMELGVQGMWKRVALGTSVAECLARRCPGVQQVVLSTQLSVVDTTGVRARHMDAKAQIARVMRAQGLPVTGVIVPMLYQQFAEQPYRPTKTANNQYYLDLPMGSVPLDLIAAEDVGPAVLALTRDRATWVGKTASLVGDKITVREVAAELSAALNPKRFEDKQVTLHQYRQKAYPGIEDIASMFDFYCRVDQRSNFSLTQTLNPNVSRFSTWLQKNRAHMDQAMEFEVETRVDPWSL